MRRSANGEPQFELVLEYFFNAIYLTFATILLLFIFHFLLNIDLNFNTFIKILLSEFVFSLVPGLFKSAALSCYDDKIKKDALTNVISALILLFTVTYIYLNVRGGENISLDLWASFYLLNAVIALCFRFFLWRRYFTARAKHRHFASIKIQMKDGFYFMIASLMRTSFLHIDKLLIIYFFGLRIAGYYAIAFRFYNVILMVTNSISGVKEAKLYNLAVSDIYKFKDEVVDIIFSTMKFYLYTIPFCILVLVFVFHLYNVDVTLILASLFFLCPMQLLSFTMLNAMNSMGKEKSRTLILVMCFIVNIFTVITCHDYIGWFSIIVGSFASNVLILFSTKRFIFKG